MKKAICALLSVAMIFTGAAGTFANDNYSIGGLEVPYSRMEAEALKEAGLFSGTDRGFELEKKVTRAEAAAMILRLSGETPAPADCPFKDISGHWAQSVIAYASAKGYVTGTGDAAFEPERSVTGREFARMILSAMGYKNVSLDNAYDTGIESALLVNNYTKAAVSEKDYQLIRSDLVYFCYSALLAKNAEGKLIKDVLLNKGAITEEKFNSIFLVECGTDHIWDLNSLMPKDRNYMFSPLSIKMAMAMAAEGAGGDTRMEILKAFEIHDLDKYNEYAAKLIDEYSNNEDVQLKTANSIWLNTDYLKGADFAETFRNKIVKYYKGEVRMVTNADAVKTINSWVLEKTNGKIKDMVSDSDFLSMLVNAIYFKGAWKFAFDENLTAKDIFTDKNGKSTDRDFMNNTGNYEYIENSSLKMIRLPYADGKTSMYIALGAESGLDKEIGKMECKWISLSIPKFRTEFSADLNDMFKIMGITSAFDMDNSDLTPMFTFLEDNAYISKVSHKTFIDVNESGTEAAAATSVAVETKSAPREPLEFKADRPFTYFIRDDINGQILFMGEYGFAE